MVARKTTGIGKAAAKKVAPRKAAPRRAKDESSLRVTALSHAMTLISLNQRDGSYPTGGTFQAPKPPVTTESVVSTAEKLLTFLRG